MPEISLEERVRSTYDRLSPSHQRVVEYLLSQDSAAFSTARQLAESLGLSESTVVRLAPELGYEGFPALQSEFQQRLLSRIGWRPPLQQAIESLPDDPDAIFRQVFANDIRSLESTLSSVSREGFERAVEAIVGARTVYFLGLRTSAGHALYATMRLRLVRHQTQLLSPHFGDLADQMLGMGHGDLLVAISFYRYAADTVRALRHARDLGVCTMVITDNPVSPPANAAEIVLVAHALPSNLFHSLVAPMSLLNALVAAAAVADKKRSTESVNRAYDVVDRFEVLLAPNSHFNLDDGAGRPTQESSKPRVRRRRPL